MAEQPVNLSTAIYLDRYSRAETSDRGDPSTKESPPIMMLAWGVAVIFLVVDLIWFPSARLTFTAGNILDLLWTALAVVGVCAAVGFVSYRLRADQSGVGRWMMRMVEGVGLLICAGTVFIALGIVGAIFTDLAQASGCRCGTLNSPQSTRRWDLTGRPF